ncbi:IS3 family transposase [Rubrivirga marina]|uniref:IS3 family transposase n=1 Tax=Rubrivirga marina TaxID=1196024 RepID=UPI0015CAAEB4|nr:IS3 family transposase [Rubrivirga marina]
MTLKSEAIHDHRFETQAEVRSALFDYLETLYSTRRRHASHGFLVLVAHDDRHHQRQALRLAA